MNANITALKGTEFKVFTKTQEEYDEVLRVGIEAGYKPVLRSGYKETKSYGMGFFNSMTMTDGDGIPASWNTTFTASEFITANK